MQAPSDLPPQAERLATKTFDTYDREIERYGGLVGISVAEVLFGADSHAVAELLALAQAHTLELDRTLLAVLSADDLLDSLGLTAEERLAWVRQHVTARHQSGESYRRHRTLLRNLLCNPIQTLATMPGGTEVLAVLAERREALVPVAQQLGELVTQRVLEKPLTELPM